MTSEAQPIEECSEWNKRFLSTQGAIMRAAASHACTRIADSEAKDVSLAVHAVFPPIQQHTSGSEGAKNQKPSALKPNRKPMASAETIPRLVLKLKKGSHVAKTDAAGRLCSLAADGVNRAPIAAAGAIPLLVQLLELDDVKSDTAKINATGALRSLAAIKTFKRVIVAAGAVRPLVQLLTAHTEAIQINAIATLSNLALEDENKALIAVAGAIPLLMQLSMEGSEKVQDRATRALKNLCP